MSDSTQSSAMLPARPILRTARFMGQFVWLCLVGCLLGLPSLGLAKEAPSSFVVRDSAGIHLDSAGAPTRSLLEIFHVEARRDWLGEASVRELGSIERHHLPRLHQGARVLDQDLSLMVAEAGLQRAWGRIGPVETVSDFVLDEQQARAAAEATHAGTSATRSERLWIPLQDGYRAGWGVTVQDGPAVARRLWIDAEDGTVLFDQGLLQRNSYVGSVQAYSQSPLHGEVEVLPMEGLLYPHHLDTLGLGVVDPELGGEYLYSPTAEWHYEPQDREFSVAMGYYHLTAIENWFVENTAGGLFEGMAHESLAIVNLGRDNMIGDPSLATGAVHGLLALSGQPLRHYYFFGNGEGAPVENAAHAAEIWYHEAGHAFTNEAIGTGFEDVPYDSQFGSLHEGLADFGAAMATGDLDLLEWFSGELSSRERPIDELRVFPDDYSQGDVHKNGRIISSLGWTMVKELGAETAVPLMNASRYYLTSSAAGFEALMEGILAADEDFGDGRLQVALIEAMDLHGLEPDPVGWHPDASPVLEGSSRLGEAVTILGEGSDSDGDAVLGRSWRLVEVPEDSALELSAGQRFDRDLTFTPDVCGMYTVELTVADSSRQLSAPASIDVMPCGAGCGGCAMASDGAPSSLLLLLPLGLVMRRRAGRSSRPDLRTSATQ